MKLREIRKNAGLSQFTVGAFWPGRARSGPSVYMIEAAKEPDARRAREYRIAVAAALFAALDAVALDDETLRFGRRVAQLRREGM